MGAKIVSIGEKDIILPFKAIGAEIRPASTPERVREILKSLLNEEVGIILIPDNFVPHIRDFLAQLRSTALPCILPIPTGKEKMKFGSKEIRELVKKAVGVDIIKE